MPNECQCFDVKRLRHLNPVIPNHHMFALPIYSANPGYKLEESRHNMGVPEPLSSKGLTAR